MWIVWVWISALSALYASETLSLSILAILVVPSLAIALGPWLFIRYRVMSWRGQVRAFVAPDKSYLSGKSALVLVNPHGGSSLGPSILKEIIEPMFLAAGVKVTPVFTQHAGHARAILATNYIEVPGLKSKVIGVFDVVITVSGDGMIHEIINGLCDRALNREIPSAFLDDLEVFPNALRKTLSALPIATVPAGTSNGVAASFGAFDPVSAVENILRAKAPRRVDLLYMRQKEEGGSKGGSGCRRMFDIHFCYWGISAYHDFLVEGPLRFLGPAIKLLVGAVWVISRHPSYKALFRFTPSPTPAPTVPPTASTAFSRTDTLPPPSSDLTDLPNGVPDLTAATDREITGNLRMVAIGNLGMAASDYTCLPALQPDSGHADIIVLRASMSRWQTISNFLTSNGDAVLAPWTEMYRTQHCTLTPLEPSHLMLSGESIPARTVRVDVLNQVIPVIY